MRFSFLVFFVFNFLISNLLQGQRDSIPGAGSVENEDVIEEFIQNTDEETEFDFNTVFENLDIYASKPLNLNHASQEDLEELKLLNDIQIQSLIAYRKKLGDLIAIHELQSVPSFDLATITRILPFVTVRGNLNDLNLSLKKMVFAGKNELYLRAGRILEEQKGYTPLDPGQRGSRYLGDPFRYYVRYKHSYENRLSYGFTAEKDPGEEFFKGSNQQGFDYYSAHFYLKDYNKTLKSLALGDYSVSFGQGLILNSGFGAGKSALVMNIKRNQRTIRPYTSVSEANFFRGAATTLSLGKNLELTTLASYRGRDGNVVDPNLIENELIIQSFTSLQLSGLHRTENEIADENAIKDLTFGSSLKLKKDNFQLALNGLYTKLDKSLLSTPRPYNRFYFSGDQLLNLSVDYSWVYQNFNFFGETAYSDNGSLATLNGLLIGLDRKIDFSILHRYFPRDYQSLNPNPFAESGGARNENGLYLGIQINPARRWRISGYFDIYQHPWLRFTADAPSSGYEYRGRVTYTIKRRFLTYLEVRNEIKQYNAVDNQTKVDFLTRRSLFQTKFNVSYKVSKFLELRNRLHYGIFRDGTGPSSGGYMVFQDILYKPMNFPLSFTARYAIFDTDAYGIRFYNFENDLLYSYSIPAFWGRGTRFYLNLRYRGIRNLTLEARFAQTYYTDRDVIGSGNEEINGSTRTEIKAQIKYQF